jgi:hypothetical protein
VKWQGDSDADKGEGTMKPIAIVVGLVAAVFLASAATAATDAEKCQAGKNQAAGKYAYCRQKAEKTFLLNGDATKYADAITKCTSKFTDTWQKLEDRAASAGATCPDVPLTGANFQTVIDQHTANIATALSGGGLAPSARLLKSGQTLCYGADGNPAACAGTGQDGEFQAGVAMNYVDNHDGTISDLSTALMWEKKVLWDGSTDGTNLHDADNAYRWAGDCSGSSGCDSGGPCCQTSIDCPAPQTCDTTDWQGTNLIIFGWVARLNNRCADQTTDCTVGGDAACAGIGNEKCGFAGHRDWRIPNARELLSLFDYGRSWFAVDPAFNGTSCGAGCADMGDPNCSCTTNMSYWSSTSTAASPWQVAVAVVLEDGWVDIVRQDPKSYGWPVRAVRGGL